MSAILAPILSAFGLPAGECIVQAFGSGLINNTWKITHQTNDYILQRINQQVFQQPEKIDSNIGKVASYLQQHYPEYLFTQPLQSTDGKGLVTDDEQGCFRMFLFVKNSVTYDVVQHPTLAHEAAQQFGRFTKLLSGFDASQLQITLPGFHDLSWRYNQFEQALANASAERLIKATTIVVAMQSFKYIVDIYEKIISSPDFKLRVTHHDTKISNVLFNELGKGLCVIDLDTLMPGYFISDLGDMMRTYLSPVSEEEKDTSKIQVREAYFEAIAEGYLSEMKEELTSEEMNHIVFAGKFMIYMQALRFITDYLNNDIYYGQAYEGHNLNRANNQLVLLQKLTEKESLLSKMVAQSFVIAKT